MILSLCELFVTRSIVSRNALIKRRVCAAALSKMSSSKAFDLRAEAQPMSAKKVVDHSTH